MRIRAVPVTGSGGIVPGSEISYSYSEDVSSLEPSKISGGNGQITVSAIASDENASFRAHPRLLINNIMRLEDEDHGDIEFQVRKVNVNNRLVVLTGETVEAKMNVERVAQPVGGPGATLKDAIVYYCGLVDVFPIFEDDLSDILDNHPVNYIGWRGNVWEYLKALCAGTSASTTEDVPMEMVVDVDTLKFRIAKTVNKNFTKNASSIAVDVDSFDTSRSVNINYYETEYKQNGIVREDSDADRLVGFTPGVSIQDQMQVEAGETIVKRFKINASLNSVNNPEAVASIVPIPYTGTSGQYVVVGTDDLPVQPTQWLAEGGSLTVSLTENPNEIEIRITAPEASQLQQAGDPNAFSLAPYKIGVESAGGVDYPALYITGTGVFFERKTKRFLTGASEQYTTDLEGPEIDNIFINNMQDLSTRGVAAAQALCGPAVKISISNPADLSFKDSLGAITKHSRQKYRIESVNFSQTDASLTGSSAVSFSDFNEIWSGKTFAQFTAVMGDKVLSPDDYISFNEFTAIPLNEDI